MKEKLETILKQASEATGLFFSVAFVVAVVGFVSFFIVILSHSFFFGFAFFVIATSICLFQFLHRKNQD